MKILNTTPNGLLLFCPNCKAYHLEFGNLFFRFSEEEMKEFMQKGDYAAIVDATHPYAAPRPPKVLGLQA